MKFEERKAQLIEWWESSALLDYADTWRNVSALRVVEFAHSTDELNELHGWVCFGWDGIDYDSMLVVQSIFKRD